MTEYRKSMGLQEEKKYNATSVPKLKNPGYSGDERTPASNGTAPANPVFNQNSFNTMSAVADPTQDTYGSLFT